MDQLLGVLLDLGNNPAAMTAINIVAPVLLGAILFWMIASGIVSKAARSRKRHDVALHAADTLSRLVGIVSAIGKTPTQLEVATCESFTFQLCTGRTLSKPDMAALAGLRQLILTPREDGTAFDKAKFTEHSAHLSRILSGAGPNPLPSLKLAQKQLQDATGSKPAAPAKKSEAKPAPAPAKVEAPAPAPAAKVAAAPAPAPAAVVPAAAPPASAAVPASTVPAQAPGEKS